MKKQKVDTEEENTLFQQTYGKLSTDAIPTFSEKQRPVGSQGSLEAAERGTAILGIISSLSAFAYASPATRKAVLPLFALSEIF